MLLVFIMFVIFYLVYKAVSSPKIVAYYTAFWYSETKRRSEKRLTLSRPIIYYNNTTTSKKFLSGDIETKSGPTKKNYPLKYSRQCISVGTSDSCRKPVRSNAKRLICFHCKNLTHLICSKFRNNKYRIYIHQLPRHAVSVISKNYLLLTFEILTK